MGETADLKAYLVGMGGVGMSALARLMLEAGWQVEGCDHKDGPRLQALRGLGALIHIGHDPARVLTEPLVIYSQVVPRRNSELAAARAAGRPMQTRADALAGLLGGREVVAVAGSHGKSTTTAMLAFVLRRAGLDPGHMVGGACASLDRIGGRLGSGPIFVLEACEAFGDLDSWRPSHTLVTNLDDEHLEHYGDQDALKAAFQRLVGRTPAAGVIAVCGDDAGAASLAAERPGAVATYGLDPDNAVRASNLSLTEAGSSFTVVDAGVVLGEVRLCLPGRHNVRNALGCVAMATRLGAPFEIIARALADFRGVDRRWQAVGEAAGVRVFDDYAHHPTEVDATLQVARAAVGTGGRLIVAFEPQLHARVRRLARAFAAALQAADLVLLAPVDAAEAGPASRPSDDLLAEAALVSLRSGDVLVTMGPGAISGVGPMVLEGLGQGLGGATAGPSISQGRRVPRESGGLLALAADRALRDPDAPAVECGDVRFRYGELMARAAGLAEALRAAGVAPGDVVAVAMPRSAFRPAAFLGVLIAGGVFLPIDPALPRRRIGFICKDARVRVVIASAAWRPELADAAIGVVLADETAPAEDWRSRPPTARDGGDAAYLIYTSGTTGEPKGVIVEHAALANFALAAAEAFELAPASRVSGASAFGFDVAVGETAMALAAGACLVSPTEATGRPGAPLGRFVQDAAITHLSLTPSALASLPDYGYRNLSHVIVAGEACPADLAHRWGRGRAFFNAYGPTEATVYATFERYVPGEELTIGRAMDNTSAFILDEAGGPVPRGQTGELWLAGAGLARGYLRRPELTAERFRNVRPDGETTLRAYRTGDIAAMLPDGRIRFQGRADDQIKLRGYRIELGEIEACLRSHPGIADAIVAVRKDGSGSDRLVAYVTPNPDGPPPDEDQALAHLAKRLPPYMIPAAVVAIAAIPLSANGKRDRAALPHPPRLSGRHRNRRPPKPPATPVETALHALFRRELAIEGDFGIRDRLGELGADSLKTANLFLALEAHFGVELPAEAVGEADTVELMAVHVERALAPGARPQVQPPSEDAWIVRRQLAYLLAWTGSRLGSQALVVTRGDGASRPPLFWCFQGNEEHEQLAAHLGRGQTLHGMRSGHLIFRYAPENVAALAARYVQEIVALQPEGPIRLGGNCQGGTVALEIARQLQARGREVAIVFLLDQGRFPASPAPVSLIFGDDSHLNPYLTDEDPERIFAAAYAAGYSVDFLTAPHGAYFEAPAVETLARIVAVRLAAIDAAANVAEVPA